MKIDVPSAAFRSGALLEISRCARHDVPPSRSRNRRFSTDLPGIVLLLAFFSFFLVLLVASVFQKEVSGPVPECDRCATTYRRRITSMWLSLVSAVGLVVASVAWASGPLLLTAIALLVLGIVFGARADQGRVRGTLDSGLDWVELRGVDPAFAAEVQARVQSAPQLDPWVTPAV